MFKILNSIKQNVLWMCVFPFSRRENKSWSIVMK